MTIYFTAKHAKSKDVESPPTIAKAAPAKAPKAEVDVAGVAAAKKKTDGGLVVRNFDGNFGARKGWGSEASAKVFPPTFKFAGSDLKLERDYFFRDYNGNVLLDKGDYTANIPPGNDSGPAKARDDNPDPKGAIYDWDAAGLNIPDKPKGAIMRTRNNFKAFASITVEGKKVRCSEVREYRIRFSQQQTKDPHGAEWKTISPSDVAGDNEASHGTTNVTWDLK